MPSVRYQSLCDRIGELESHLLPASFAETGVYVDQERVEVLALSFRVLSHAEMEAYFEDRVIEVAKRALASWKAEKHVSGALLSLLAFSDRQMRKPPETLAAPGANKEKVWPTLLDPSFRVEECVSSFVGCVSRENHGIREHNLLAMLLPVGIQHSDLDPVLVAAFDSFGRSRGEAAHTSTATKKGVDPKDERETVRHLVHEIAALDACLDGVLTAAAN